MGYTTMVNQTKKDTEEQSRIIQEKLNKRMGEIHFKILVLSGKGGVGKSTVSANLAKAILSQHKNVGLLDVDIHGPSIPSLLGINKVQFQFMDNEIIPIDVMGKLKVVSIGFLLDKNTDAVIWRGPRKFHVIRQFLTDVKWGNLDYLVVDSPPGTGDEPMSVAQLVGSPCGAVVVTTPQDIAVQDVRRCITFCRTLSVPVLGIIENMSGLVCPQCGEMIELFKSGGGESLAKEMDVPFLGRIPLDPNIVQSGDEGDLMRNDKVVPEIAKLFIQIAQKILEKSKY